METTLASEGPGLVPDAARGHVSTASVVTLGEALDSADQLLTQGGGYTSRLWRTGFSPLDQHLAGGLRAGELVLVAGAQGLGKTTFALQAARNLAAAGHSVLYVCYEHPAEQLAERLLVLEAGLAEGDRALTLEEARRTLSAHGAGGYAERLGAFPGAREALTAVRGYADRLHLLSARGDSTTLQDVRAAATACPEPPLVVVDYLQKVAVPEDDGDEDRRVARIATGLKDLALDLRVPVVAVCAVEQPPGDTRRVRTRHLKGSVTLAYEADVVLVLNEKFDVVARHHLVYDTGNAERFHGYVVCSIEKNRSGENHLDLEFRKRFAHSSYDPSGSMVSEQLLDERVHLE